MGRAASTRSITMNAIDKAIGQALDAINDYTAQIQRLNEARDYPLLASILEILDTEDRVSVSVTKYGISVHIVMTSLNGFKDPRLMVPMERILDLSSDWQTETTDYAATLNRDFRFSLDLNNKYYTVIFAAYAKTDNPTCRKVKVGEETQVTDKFEIICE